MLQRVNNAKVNEYIINETDLKANDIQTRYPEHIILYVHVIKLNNKFSAAATLPNKEKLLLKFPKGSTLQSCFEITILKVIEITRKSNRKFIIITTHAKSSITIKNRKQSNATTTL